MANTAADSLEYILYLNAGITSFPNNFNHIRLMEVPSCEIPYNHTAVSISEESSQDIDIQIFPNPISNQSLISNPFPVKITSIELDNVTGKLIRVESYNFDIIKTNRLKSGIYYLKVYADKKGLTTKKIIKK
jgi:hypothetical protein